MWSRIQHIVMMSATVLALSGCASHRTVAVDVRDALTKQPVSGARVRIQPLHFFLPTRPYAVLNPLPPGAEQARTDSNGQAVVAISADNPSRVFIISEHYPLQYYLFAPDKDAMTSETWHVAEPPDGRLADHKRLEIRLSAGPINRN